MLIDSNSLVALVVAGLVASAVVAVLLGCLLVVLDELLKVLQRVGGRLALQIVSSKLCP